ncbi:MAG: molybdopterin-synthase adenylyltransferase MoeB [Nitrospinota bacterium]
MVKSFRDLVEEAKKEVSEVSAEEVMEKLNGGEDFVLIDCRDPDEYRQGYISGALPASRGTLELKVNDLVPDGQRPIIVYCAAGARSLLAARSLKQMGYRDVKSMAGGFNGWKEKGFPIVVDKQLTPDQITRYSRQFILPQVGEKGQLKLLEAKVFLIGAGGLGSPAAVYLAAAGVGTMGIVDSDVVDLSNLQRQILHTTDRIGVPKTESAKETLLALNPDLTVKTYQERLTSKNIMDIIADYDIIVDGCDNFPTRYLVNDACVLAGKTNVHGSIFQFEGQCTIFEPGEGPCYRCLYPSPPPPGLVPSCQEAGVLGVLPGIIGMIQATETVKLILGQGDTLVGRLLTYDALKMKFRELRLRRDPACPICGENPSIRELIDYEWFCGLREEAVHS